MATETDVIPKFESATADAIDVDENKFEESSKEKLTTDTKEDTPKIPFKCAQCNFTAACEYKGKKPPFAKNINFNEDSYIMQDPFSPPPSNLSNKSNSEYFIVIGSDCVKCQKVVCSANTCSIFYGQTYCAQCANYFVTQFPLEIQSKIRKCFSNI